MENRIRWFLDRENEDGEEIDFALLVPIQAAKSADAEAGFLRGFVFGYALAAATALVAIVLCSPGR